MVDGEAASPRSEQARFWGFVRGRLAERRMTQAELARRLHLDRSVLTRRLNGQIRERPTEMMVDQLVVALRLSPPEARHLRSLAGFRAVAEPCTPSEPSDTLGDLPAAPPVDLSVRSNTAAITDAAAADWSAPRARSLRWSRPVIGLGLVALSVIAAAVGFASALYLVTSGSILKPPAPHGIVLRDDFSDQSSGWPTGQEPAYGYERSYANGEYLIASPSGLRGLARANRTDLLLRNIVVEVDARLPNPSPKVGVFVGVRLDATGYLRFEVWPDYRFCVFTRMTGVRDEVVPARLVYRSDYQTIHPGTAINRIGIRALGSTFVGLVNGEEVLRLDDGSFLEGGLTLGVLGTSPELAVEARFDNLVVTSITTVR